VFEACDLIVLSPDVPADLPPLEEARRRGVRVIGEVELAAPFLKGETIGITGSNGKTTTTSLVGHILRAAGVPVQVGGNIGTPVTAMVESSRADGWNVLGAFQFSTRDHFRVPGAYRAGAERDREPPRPPPHVRELCGRQGPAV
jgi:UDP-N-acetylmuramoylalanine--D-glutamate ligase